MPSKPPENPALDLPPIEPRRDFTENLTARLIAVGGSSVMLAIALIFIYLLWVVFPIFLPARIAPAQPVPVTSEPVRLVDSNESLELGLRILASGHAEFFDLKTGSSTKRITLRQAIARARSIAGPEPRYLITYDDGHLAVLGARYRISFDGEQRSITPSLRPLFTAEPFPDLNVTGALDHHLILSNDRALFIRLHREGLTVIPFAEPTLGQALEQRSGTTIPLDGDLWRLFGGPSGQWVYVLGRNGRLRLVSLRDATLPQLVFDANLLPPDRTLTAATSLLGDFSLLLGDDAGGVSQWYPVQTDNGTELLSPRRFELQAVPIALTAEPRRKGFIALDDAGALTLFHSTSQRKLAATRLPADQQADSVVSMMLAPRADLLLLGTRDGDVFSLAIRNKHPELSLQTLWGKVWYEGYDTPRYSWQSSSADNAFEPKFSLVPLAFGTLKAALYALLVAIPLALMGAIYTAYFMAPAMRRIVKPGIEIMAALPTVVLGFLAGLWLAPVIEDHLLATLLYLPLTVVFVVALAALVANLPASLQRWLDGWYSLLLVPVLLICLPLAGSLGELLEARLFEGGLKLWLSTELDLPYDQRNALIVGIAMGVAVIPTIFSLAEDAIYGVPQHLSHASLALGATRWQTLVRVVLVTASPGIFSAVMIGFGRAVGETMIVLMATGNTPIMDWNLFQGMRTFAANIAVELPESEVGSTHYRILFLAALVLFLVTFALNTLAEFVRQRLRYRYGNL